MSILADAMTVDAASSQPRKRGWKARVLGLACVVAVVTFALLAIAPKPEPVRVWFVRATNELGTNRLVFQGTNGLPGGIGGFAGVRTGARRRARTIAELNPFIDGTVFGAGDGTNFNFTLKAPETNVPYHVVWTFHVSQVGFTPWNRFQMRWHKFFLARGMTGVAERVAFRPPLHYIPSTEIKE